MVSECYHNHDNPRRTVRSRMDDEWMLTCVPGDIPSLWHSKLRILSIVTRIAPYPLVLSAKNRQQSRMARSFLRTSSDSVRAPPGLHVSLADWSLTVFRSLTFLRSHVLA